MLYPTKGDMTIMNTIQFIYRPIHNLKTQHEPPHSIDSNKELTQLSMEQPSMGTTPHYTVQPLLYHILQNIAKHVAYRRSAVYSCCTLYCNPANSMPKGTPSFPTAIFKLDKDKSGIRRPYGVV